MSLPSTRLGHLFISIWTLGCVYCTWGANLMLLFVLLLEASSFDPWELVQLAPWALCLPFFVGFLFVLSTSCLHLCRMLQAHPVCFLLSSEGLGARSLFLRWRMEAIFSLLLLGSLCCSVLSMSFNQLFKLLERLTEQHCFSVSGTKV